MRRRSALVLPLLVAACGLSERPYAERRDWPLIVTRPQTVPPRATGHTLLIRDVRAGPGMDARGLQSVQPDGSVRTEFYEEWSVPPVEGVDASLRRWLVASGLFKAVLEPYSRASADFILESDLLELCTVVASGVAKAEMGIALLQRRGGDDKVLQQFVARGETPLSGRDIPDSVRAQLSALAAVFTEIEQHLSASLPLSR